MSSQTTSTPETVRSFERGLRVIRAFGEGAHDLTLADVARVTDLSRATVRRLLFTLEQLQYVRRVGDRFMLTPRVLDLGYAYLSSFGLPQLTLPYIEQLSEKVSEASSVGVLDGTEVVYVARVPAKRIMTVSIGLGTRFPAYRTSLGRAMLADLPDGEISDIWETSDHRDPTPKTPASLDELMERVAQVRQEGYALVDEELEVGVRSVAAPLHDASGRVVAAVNISSHASRTSLARMQEQLVPALLQTTSEIDHALASRPS